MGWFSKKDDLAKVAKAFTVNVTDGDILVIQVDRCLPPQQLLALRGHLLEWIKKRGVDADVVILTGEVRADVIHVGDRFEYNADADPDKYRRVGGTGEEDV